MKTSFVSKVPIRYLVATLTAILVVTGVGKTNSVVTVSDESNSSQTETILDSDIEKDDFSTSDSVTTDASTFSVNDEHVENVVVNHYGESLETKTDDFIKDDNSQNDENQVDSKADSIGHSEKKKASKKKKTSKKKAYKPVSTDAPNDNHLTSFKGVSYFTDESGITHRETYYDMYMDGVVSIMRNEGFSEKEYPYWVDKKRGTKMLGPYIMIAANLYNHPRGSIVNTDLGKALVCDTGGFAYNHTEGYDIAVDWDYNSYPGYNC